MLKLKFFKALQRVFLAWLACLDVRLALNLPLLFYWLLDWL